MRLLCALFLVLVTGSALPQSTDKGAASGVTIRAYLDPEGEINVGQLVRLWVEVTSPTWFTKAPRYPEFPLDGAIVLLPEQLGVNFTDRGRSGTRTGQRQRYAIIPQRAGTFVIPALPVTLGVSVDGKPSAPITVRTEPIELTAVLPPGTEDLDQLLTTRKLSVEERYDRDVSGIKVGDTITRTVVMRGEDTFALALPKVDFRAVDGARLYPVRPKLNDTVNRGQYRAERTDAATYVFETEGTINLPEIAVRWWNLEGSRIEEVVLPEVSFTVAANPAYQPAGGSLSKTMSLGQQVKESIVAGLLWLRTNVVWITLAAIGIYIALLAWRRFVPRLIEKWRAERERLRHSEKRYFREFKRACRIADSDRMVDSFWRWMDHLTPADRTASLEQLTTSSADGEFLQMAQQEAKRRYGPSAKRDVDAGAVYRDAARFRQRIVERAHANPAERETLNPRVQNGAG